MKSYNDLPRRKQRGIKWNKYFRPKGRGINPLSAFWRIKVLLVLIAVLLIQCTKNLAPSVSTFGISGITSGGAYCEGWIKNEEAMGIRRGFVCRTEDNSDVKTYETIYADGSHIYGTVIYDLKPNTTYFVKAYVSNDEGTGYGEEIEFKTTRTGDFTDSRDGKIYKWVEIGNQTWMAENLSYIPFVSNLNDSGIFVYNYEGLSVEEAKKTNEYIQYGCLYDWEIACEVCPDGWHLPSDDEWKELEIYLGMNPQDVDDTGWRGSYQGGILKEEGADHWQSPNYDAINSSIFSALPAGCGSYDDPYFNGLRVGAYFFSSTMDYAMGFKDGYRVWIRELSSSTNTIKRAHNSGYSRRCSVRCVKN